MAEKAGSFLVGGGDASLGLGKIHFARDRLQHAIGHAAPLNSQIKKVGAFGLILAAISSTMLSDE
jgi:hypothetical protein